MKPWQRSLIIAFCILLLGFLFSAVAQVLPPKAQPPVMRGTLLSAPTLILPPPGDPVAKDNSTNASLTNSTKNVSRATMVTKDGCLEIGFDRLSDFQLVLSNYIWDTTRSLSVLKVSGEIPEAIKGLNNRRVAIKGFMLPVKMEADQVQEFMLLKNQMACCFGGMPQINDWVYVRMGAKGVKICMDQPLTIYGTFHVGQFQHPNGVQFGIYQLDGEKLELPEKL